jgi:hypothetical protein
MSKIYSGKHLSHYAQVMLFDPNIEKSIPEWGENESIDVSASGLYIATSKNTKIEVFICNSETDISPDLSKIGVRNSGFRVGNVTTNSLADVPYKAGNCHIKIYGYLDLFDFWRFLSSGDACTP